MSIKTLLLVVLVAFSLGSCKSSKEKIYGSGAISKTELKILEYDTLEGVFLYEYDIGSYVYNSSVIKGDGLIRCDSNFLPNYSRGYYILNTSYFDQIKGKHSNLQANYESVGLFKGAILKPMFMDPDFAEKCIKPYCHTYYGAFRIKMIVLRLGTIRQRIPLFMNCEEFEAYEKKYKKNFQLASIPTYVVTDVLEWEAIGDLAERY